MFANAFLWAVFNPSIVQFKEVFIFLIGIQICTKVWGSHNLDIKETQFYNKFKIIFLIWDEIIFKIYFGFKIAEALNFMLYLLLSDFQLIIQREVLWYKI